MRRFDDPRHPDPSQRPPWVAVRLDVTPRHWPDDVVHPWIKENCRDEVRYYFGGVFRFHSDVDAVHAILLFGTKSS